MAETGRAALVRRSLSRFWYVAQEEKRARRRSRTTSHQRSESETRDCKRFRLLGSARSSDVHTPSILVHRLLWGRACLSDVRLTDEAAGIVFSRRVSAAARLYDHRWSAYALQQQQNVRLPGAGSR